MDYYHELSDARRKAGKFSPPATLTWTGRELGHTWFGWGYVLSDIETRNRVGDDGDIKLCHDSNPGCFRRVRETIRSAAGAQRIIRLVPFVALSAS